MQSSKASESISKNVRPPRLPTNVRLLGMASLLNDVASERVYPLLPQFLLTVLGGNRFQIGVIEGIAESVASLLKLASGDWSDRLGRRKELVVAGYALAALTRPVVALVAAPWQLFSLRVLDRAGKGVRTAPRDAMIADSADPAIRGRAFGFHRAMDHLGAGIGPLLAAAFLFAFPTHLRTLFLLTLVPGLAVVAVLAFGLRETRSQPPPAGPGDDAQGPLIPRVRYYIATAFLFTLGNSNDAFLLVRASELGMLTLMLPLLWTAFHAVKSAGNLLAGPAVDQHGPRRLIIAGWVWYALIYAGFGLATAAWQVWLLFLAYALFYAVSEPAERTYVSALSCSANRGRAFGWFNFAIGIGALPASLLFGWLYQQYGPLLALGWGAVLALVAAVLLALQGPQALDDQTAIK